MDPDQTAPVGSTLFGEEASKTLQQTTKQTTFVVIVLFLNSDDFCCLLITFANSLDSDQD